MTQNYIILLFFIEFAVAYLIVYSLRNAGKWVNAKNDAVNNLIFDFPENIKNFREELKDLNAELLKKQTVQPLSSNEIGLLIADILGELLTINMPIKPLNKKLAIFSLIYKLWKNRQRIKATMF